MTLIGNADTLRDIAKQFGTVSETDINAEQVKLLREVKFGCAEAHPFFTPDKQQYKTNVTD